mmetsp:Transcript_29179/g.43984  ORF Transcript_29179/g.43984 Transcript_29179/m.43984 type:complete len:93 (-) Transcript_29179:2647-2925(-)
MSDKKVHIAKKVVNRYYFWSCVIGVIVLFASYTSSIIISGFGDVGKVKDPRGTEYEQQLARNAEINFTPATFPVHSYTSVVSSAEELAYLMW